MDAALPPGQRASRLLVRGVNFASASVRNGRRAAGKNAPELLPLRFSILDANPAPGVPVIRLAHPNAAGEAQVLHGLGRGHEFMLSSTKV